MEDKSGNIAMQLLDRLLASRWGHTKLFVGAVAFVIAMFSYEESLYRSRFPGQVDDLNIRPPSA